MITPVNSIDSGYMPYVSGSQPLIQNKGQANSSPANTVNPNTSSQSYFSKYDKSTVNEHSDKNGAATPIESKDTKDEASETEKEKLEQVQQVVDQLKARDREVRAHEQAHLAAAGAYATGLSFTYQSGPDGQKYAVGGEVGIDTSAIPGDPEATIQKAMVIQRAAMAPAEPSSQDYKVASQAAAMMAQAQSELAKQSSEDVKLPESANDTNKSPSDESKVPPQIAANDQSADQSGLIVSAERQQFNLRMQLPAAPLLAS